MARSDPEIPDKRRLKSQYDDELPRLEEITDLLFRHLRERLLELEVHATVKTRVKGFESYYRKLLRRMRAASNSESIGSSSSRAECDVHLTDIIGVRVVCPFLEDLHTVCAFIERDFEVLEFEEKGARRSFREFGYESTHYLVRVPEQYVPAGLDWTAVAPEGGPVACEIQLCTLLQDAWAEVEHELIYKAEFTPLDEPLRRKMAALNANLTLSDIIFQEIREYQRSLRDELQKRRGDFLRRADAFGPLNGRMHAEEAATAPREAQRPAQTNPESIDELLLAALFAHNDGSYPEAISIYSKILAAGPMPELMAIILVHRGMAHFARAGYDSAIDDFTSAIQIDPANARAYYYRGIVNRMRGELGRALDDLDRSLQFNPFEFDAFYSRAQICFDLGDFTRALSDCDSALRIEPDSREASSFRKLVLGKLRV